MWKNIKLLSTNSNSKPAVGVSACLYGEKVRYDGQSKLYPELIKQLATRVDLIPLCPEVAIGMGVPRPPIQLVNENNRVEAVGVDDNDSNVTEQLADYAQQVANDHAPGGAGRLLCGYLFKSRSPSCGLGSTPIYRDDLHVGFGDGIYAHHLKRMHPWLPVAEESDLEIQQARDKFLLLSLLVHDFYQLGDSKQEREKFSAHYSNLLTALLTKHEVTQLAESASHTQYLTRLMHRLEDTPPQLLKATLEADLVCG